MNFISQYLTILVSAKEMITMCEENNEKENPNYKLASDIYKNAFRGLLQEGYPYKASGDRTYLVIGDKEYVLKTDLFKMTGESVLRNMPEKYRRPIPVDDETEEEVFDGAAETDYDEEDEETITFEENRVGDDGVEEENAVMEEPDDNVMEILDDTESSEDEDIEPEMFVDMPDESDDEEEPEFIEEPEFEEELEFDQEAFNIGEEESIYEPDEIEVDQNDSMSQGEDSVEIPELEKEKKPVVAKVEKKEEDKPATPFESPLDDIIKDVTVQMTRDTQMPACMFKSDFTFVYDTIAVENKEQNEFFRFKVVVYPFVLDEEVPAIIACINNNRYQSVVVCDKKGEIRFSAGTCPVIIKGTFEDGVFEANYDVSRGFKADGYTVTVEKRQTFGTKGHILLAEDSDAVIHVMPTGFKNDENTKHAKFMYYIKDDNGIRYDVTDRPVPFVFQGSKMELVAKWKMQINNEGREENELFCDVNTL